MTDTSSDKYPKTLIIRNHNGGMIWQIYHVQAKHEADQLSANATKMVSLQLHWKTINQIEKRPFQIGEKLMVAKKL